eukprot:778713-Pelagomonas_calceolata.AAC.5
MAPFCLGKDGPAMGMTCVLPDIICKLCGPEGGRWAGAMHCGHVNGACWPEDLHISAALSFVCAVPSTHPFNSPAHLKLLLFTDGQGVQER